MEGDKKTKQRKTKNVWQINKCDNIKGQGNKVNTQVIKWSDSWEPNSSWVVRKGHFEKVPLEGRKGVVGRTRCGVTGRSRVLQGGGNDLYEALRWEGFGSEAQKGQGGQGVGSVGWRRQVCWG